MATENIMLVTITGPDQVGVVSSVTACLFDLGANMGDTAFSVLGAGFKFTGVADFHAEMSPNMVLHELSALEPLKDAEIEVTPFKFDKDHPGNATPSHRISVHGGDQPGLLARLSEVFTEYGANIVRLNSMLLTLRNGETVYNTQIDVHIPPMAEERCLAAINNTTGQMNLNCQSVKLEA